MWDAAAGSDDYDREASVSKIKNISRTGWLVAGIVAALLLVPTTAVAVTTATITIIKGGTSAGEANVTAAHQLLSTTANPNAYVNTTYADITGQSAAYAPIASPPSGDALIVTTIHLNTYNDPTPGPADFITFVIETGTACSSGSHVGSYVEPVTPGTLGETDIPYNPGLAVPAGDALCAAAIGSYDAWVSATGYTVPSSEVPAGPLHRLPALPQPQG
jgi:hypothetical protein